MEFGVAIVRRDVGTIVGDVVKEFISTAGAGVGSKTLVMFGILSTITSCWSSPACIDTFCGTLAMLNNVVKAPSSTGVALEQVPRRRRTRVAQATEIRGLD